MITAADAVVIGGGCMGASTAYFLARRGAKNVVLLERRHLASGPTGKSSAVVRQHYPLKELVVTSLRSLRMFEGFDEVVGGDPGFVRTGYVLLVSDAHRDELNNLVAMQAGLGVNVRMLTREELQELQPQTNLEDFESASHHPEAGYANPVATTNLFADGARRLGAQVYDDTEVTAVEVKGDKIAGVVTDRGVISTPIVVNAAGAWGDRIGKMVGVELPLRPTRHQICLFKRPYDFWQPQMIYADGPLRTYYRPEGSDMLLAGAANDVFSRDQVDPDAYDEETDPETLPWFLSRIQHRFPVMKTASYRGGYSGVYDTTPDEQPMIGPVPEVRGFYCLMGTWDLWYS